MEDLVQFFLVTDGIKFKLGLLKKHKSSLWHPSASQLYLLQSSRHPSTAFPGCFLLLSCLPPGGKVVTTAYFTNRSKELTCICILDRGVQHREANVTAEGHQEGLRGTEKVGQPLTCNRASQGSAPTWREQTKEGIKAECVLFLWSARITSLSGDITEGLSKIQSSFKYFHQ